VNNVGLTPVPIILATARQDLTLVLCNVGRSWRPRAKRTTAINLRKKMSGQTTQLRGINTQYESFG
jgi:hypothetical protein